MLCCQWANAESPLVANKSPHHGRRFSSPADFNAQQAMWLRRANNRVHSRLRCRPTERRRLQVLSCLRPTPSSILG